MEIMTRKAPLNVHEKGAIYMWYIYKAIFTSKRWNVDALNNEKKKHTQKNVS